MTSRPIALALLGLAVGLGFPAAVADDRPADELARQLPRIAPVEARQAASALRLEPGLKAILAAAEPMVADPVACCFDAAGRLYVVEMRGYPFPEPRPTGRIKRLTDEDGDGVYDRATTFLDDLNWPTSVVPYHGGVFVACAPDLLYARDDSGDGVADLKKTMFTGFGTQNVQQLLNGLCWGLDGWIHGAAAGNGGEIRNLTRPEAKPVSIRGRDFRFRPDGSAFEATSGGGQFGHVFDDWGHKFVCNNRWHARQVVLAARYLANNPDLVAPVIADIAADGNEAAVYRISPPEPWRVVRSKQYEAKMKVDANFARRLPNAERHAAGFFSSASGMTLYRGTAFLEPYRGNAFVCDVAGNLVHRKRLAPSGAIYRAERVDPDRKSEFLASPDIWFRPVNLANTPDGTLLVLDMYRETIEHPLSIPDDIKAHLDLKSGDTRGRIYEIVPDGYRRKPRPTLDGSRPVDVARLLGHPDAWVRETAQRLLTERGAGRAAVDDIRTIARRPPSAQSRVSALWTLANLGALDAETLLEAFRDPESGVRENACQLAEGRAAAEPSLASALIAAADDPSPMVRFQSALSLGFVRSDDALAALARIARRDSEDRWTRLALLTAVHGREMAFLAATEPASASGRSTGGRALLEDLGEIIGAGKDEETRAAFLDRYLSDDADPASARAAMVGLARGLRRTRVDLASILGGRYAARLDALGGRAAALAGDLSKPLEDRLEAIRLLALGDPERALKVLPERLDVREAPEVQIEALRVLGGLGRAEVAAVVVAHWNRMGPAGRREAAEVLTARPEGAATLLQAIERREVDPKDLDSTRQRQLTDHPDPTIRGRAAAVFAASPSRDRAGVLAAYMPALDRAGDPGRGRLAFRKVCASCHRVENEGRELGPSLATVAAKPAQEIAIHVLDPNREVAPAFVNYNVAMTDGRLASGVVAEESATALVLKRAEGVTETIPRDRIEQLTATGLSLMPEGLERSLTPTDLADVIAYIRSLAPSASR